MNKILKFLGYTGKKKTALLNPTTTEELKALFPLKGKVTKKIIQESHIHNIINCIGATTLKAALLNKGVNTKKIYITWGRNSGYLSVTIEGKSFSVSIHTDYDMMEIIKPKGVVFYYDQVVCYNLF
jgi:hypothetical protein